MSKVINIEDALKQCKIEVINITTKDLLLPEYQQLNKYFGYKRKRKTKQKNNFIESLFFGLFI